MNAVVIVVILVIAFAASLFTMAFLTARMRRTRGSLDAADDATARGLYDRYVADVAALTREYLRHAPTDDEWLTKVRERPKAPDWQQRSGDKPCSSPQFARGLGWNPHRLHPLEMPLAALTVGVTFSVLALSLLDQGHVGWWLAPVTVAIGTTLGKLIGSVTQEEQAKEGDHGRIGAGRRSLLVTPGSADDRPGGPGPHGRRGRT